MSLDALREQLPDYAKDIRLNLGTLAAETSLSDQQKYGAFLASALASRNATVTRSIAAWTADKLSPEAATAAKAAAAIMGMNNIYYRATHLMENEEYAKLPAKLRMNIIGSPGVEKVDFELWSLAVSAVNGCGMCLDSHEKVVRKGGLTTEQIQTALRIAAVVHAAAATLDGEEALR
ncbi:MAG: carboxymuconolactone decarboxylase family protein [Pseudomonadota bacterium]|nr:carboxymuconolactone decarboxylase family protein [Pseudomonadota bacterium]